MKTSDLTGAPLDYWVAKAEGFMRPRIEKGACVVDEPDGHLFEPSTNWAVAGPIIDRRKIMIAWNVDHWISGCHETTERPGGHIWTGRTALIAAMRVCVAAVYGEQVPD